jgi:hypothetical protein
MMLAARVTVSLVTSIYIYISIIFKKRRRLLTSNLDKVYTSKIKNSRSNACALGSTGTIVTVTAGPLESTGNRYLQSLLARGTSY